MVWSDRRNEAEGHCTESDIYAYDLKANREIPIAVHPGSQRGAIIDGDTVVWSDNRNNPLLQDPDLDLPHMGCAECPDNRYDIYAYDFSTGEEMALVHDGFNNRASSLHGKLMGWLAINPDEPRSLKILNLATSEERTVAEDISTYYGPRVSSDLVVWASDFPCDVLPKPEKGTGVYAQSLETGETWQLSDYVEPLASVHGRTVFVLELCFGIRRAYAVFLD